MVPKAGKLPSTVVREIKASGLTLPPGARGTIMGVVLLVTATGGGTGIGALVTSLRRDPSKAVDELKVEVAQLRSNMTTDIQELKVAVGKLERRAEADDAVNRAAMNRVGSFLRQPKPDIQGALRALDE